MTHRPSVPREALAALALSALLACGGGKDVPRTGLPAGAACSSLTQCRTGLVCFQGRCATEALAAASCPDPTAASAAIQDKGVVPILEADYASPSCVRTMRDPTPDLSLLARGERAVGEEFTFTVPPGTASFSIVKQEVNDSAVDETVQLETDVYPNWVAPAKLTTPGGQLYFDDVEMLFSVDDTTQLDAFHVAFTESVGTFTTGSTSRSIDAIYTAGGVPSGTWRMRVNDLAYECLDPRLAPHCKAGASTAGRYDVSVVARPGAPSSTGTLDLAVYLVTADVTSAEAPTSPGFRRFVASVRQILARAGVCLGTVSVYDMPDWARTRWSDMDVAQSGPCGPMSQLFTTAQPKNAVHLFLVDNVHVGTSSENVVGQDGTIPGPSAVPGTITSGAVVEAGGSLADDTGCLARLDPVSCGPDAVAYIAAHEAGHWLGLFHTSEQYGSFWDPLQDTATCTCDCVPPADQAGCRSQQESNPGVEPLSCNRSATCGGGSNLMFWLFQPGVSSAEVTPEQGRVIRLNPAVR